MSSNVNGTGSANAPTGSANAPTGTQGAGAPMAPNEGTFTSGPGLGASDATTAPTPKPSAPKGVDVAQLVEERLAAALAPILERLGPAPAAPQIADPVAAQAVDESRKELARLRKQIAEDKRQAHEVSMRSNVAGKLAQHVRPEAMDVALAYFLDARKAVQVVDERGSVRASWDGAEYDSIDDAIGAFLGGKQAAMFLPPPKATPAPNAKATGPAMGTAPSARQPSPVAATVAERLAQLRAAGFDV